VIGDDATRKRYVVLLKKKSEFIHRKIRRTSNDASCRRCTRTRTSVR
jgi:hypothetical protein